MESQTKVCLKCKQEKPLSEFGKNNQSKDGKTYWCLQCKREYNAWYRGTPNGIYNQTVQNQRHYKHKEVEISRKDFVEWYNKEAKICAYCDISEEDIWIMNENFSGRADRLTVDCMDNKLGYVKENLVLACGVCNLLKNDFFSYEEFRDIGQRYVKPKWQAIKSKESEVEK